jgi:enamine deaminase RidA (YjgF/YER057c/UK114 family)
MIEFLMVPGAPQPVAPFSHATVVDGWLFVTGQMPTDPDDDAAPLPQGIEAQTRRVMDNLKLVLAGAGSGLERAVCARVYLTNFERDYAPMNGSIKPISPRADCPRAPVSGSPAWRAAPSSKSTYWRGNRRAEPMRRKPPHCRHRSCNCANLRHDLSARASNQRDFRRVGDWHRACTGVGSNNTPGERQSQCNARARHDPWNWGSLFRSAITAG